MTYAPSTIYTAGRYWTGQGGVNLGIVGDTDHTTRGVSYHLGADQLAAGAYSNQTARDRAGLTNAASAIDLGKLDGTLGFLREYSNWLVAYARRNLPGSADLREIIWSPDGKVVMRWDRERGYNSAPRPGEADLSHLTHTHLSWYRDAEKRDHTAIFRAYFEVTPVDTAKLTYYQVANAKAGRPVRGENGTPVIFTTADPPASYPLLVTGKDRYLIRLPGNVAGWIAKTDVGSISEPGAIPPLPECPECPPTDQVVNATLDAAKTAIDTLKVP
jgi:hypothetical protein